jgi:hypothetical protein
MRTDGPALDPSRGEHGAVSKYVLIKREPATGGLPQESQ